MLIFILLSSFTFPAGTIWLLNIGESNVKSVIAISLEFNILSKLFVNSSSSSIYYDAN